MYMSEFLLMAIFIPACKNIDQNSMSLQILNKTPFTNYSKQISSPPPNWGCTYFVQRRGKLKTAHGRGKNCTGAQKRQKLSRCLLKYTFLNVKAVRVKYGKQRLTKWRRQVRGRTWSPQYPTERPKGAPPRVTNPHPAPSMGIQSGACRDWDRAQAFSSVEVGSDRHWAKVPTLTRI